MHKGNLHNFLLLHSDTVPETQRLQWAKEAAEGLQILHDADVVHCDVNPKNFLLEAYLGLRLQIFQAHHLQAPTHQRIMEHDFSIPDKDWRHPPTVQDDLSALGITIYFILKSLLPFPKLSEEGVEENYKNRSFSDVSELICEEVI
ncbi:hypothetical protein BUE80_DR010389 [Diplocarpon rosae]|nr:hypothetical protein BUE80_DR010389 [Diplocarpon rosae]